MISIDQSDKVVIVGYSGAGKSTLLQYFIDVVCRNFHNLVIVDPTAKFSKLQKKEFIGVVPCLNPRKGKICVKLHDPEDMEKLVRVLNRTYDPAFLVIDEVDGYINPFVLPRQFGLFSEQGRNWSQGGIFTVRRIGALNKSILSNTHYLVLFQIRNARDRQYLKGMLDVDLDRMLSALGEHDFYMIDMHMSQVLGKFRLAGQTLKTVR